MTHEDAREFIQRVMDALADPKVSAEEVGTYFSENYRQVTDGGMLDYKGFIEHARMLKSTAKNGRVRIEKIFVDGSTVISVHYVDATKLDDSQIRMKVIACFEIENGKISSTDELTYLLEGNEADRDLGSRI